MVKQISVSKLDAKGVDVQPPPPPIRKATTASDASLEVPSKQAESRPAVSKHKNSSMYKKLSEQQKERFNSLEEGFQDIVVEYYDSFGQQVKKELNEMLHLAIATEKRKDELKRASESKNHYGDSVTKTMADVLGINHKLLWQLEGVVEMYGSKRLLKFLAEVNQRGLRITASHLRELPSLGNDYKEHREPVLMAIQKGKLETTRQVQAYIEEITSVTKREVTIATPREVDPNSVGLNDADTSSIDTYERKASSKDPHAADDYSDALPPLSTVSGLNGLMEHITGHLQTSSVKLLDWHDKIVNWQSDARVESLESVDATRIKSFIQEVSSYIQKLRDISKVAEEISDMSDKFVLSHLVNSKTTPPPPPPLTTLPASPKRPPVSEKRRQYAGT